MKINALDFFKALICLRRAFSTLRASMFFFCISFRFMRYIRMKFASTFFCSKAFFRSNFSIIASFAFFLIRLI